MRVTAVAATAKPIEALLAVVAVIPSVKVGAVPRSSHLIAATKATIVKIYVLRLLRHYKPLLAVRSRGAPSWEELDVIRVRNELVQLRARGRRVTRDGSSAVREVSRQLA